MRGDKSALTEAQLRGKALFEGKASCIVCHNGPLATDQKHYNIGVPKNPAFEEDPQRQIAMRERMRSKGFEEKDYLHLDRDPGRFRATKDKADIGKFRTPPLRYTLYSSPYMHNGAFFTLEEVVDFYNRGGRTYGYTINHPDEPRKADEDWSLANMIHEVGLPVQAERGLDLQTMTDRWYQRYEPAARKVVGAAPGDPVRDIPIPQADFEDLVSDAFGSWQALANRTYVNQRNSAFHSSHGTSSTAFPGSGYRSFVLGRRDRISAQNFSAFVHSLRTPNPANDPIGFNWSDETNKDFDLICFICHTDASNGANAYGYMTVSTLSRFRHRLAPNPDGNGFDLQPSVRPTIADLDLYSTIVHELAHSFHLGDEYAESGVPQHRMHIPDSAKRFLELYANLQPLDDVGTGANFDIQKIKWQWHRVKNAAVVQSTPQKQGAPNAALAGPNDRISLRLHQGQSSRFSTGQIVRLRQRPLSIAFDVTDRLVVEQILANDELVLKVEAGSNPVTLADFAANRQRESVVQPLANNTRPGAVDIRANEILVATLPPGRASRFRDGEIVVIRFDNGVSNPVASPRFEVAVIGNDLHLALTPRTTLFRLTGFTPPHIDVVSLMQDPILFEVVPNESETPPPAGYGPDLRIIAPSVWSHLVGHRAPLTREGTNAQCKKDDHEDLTQAVVSEPAGIPKCTPRERAQIIALYDGGSGYHCGVVHPSGFSNMRVHDDGNGVIPFDHVSRFVMVDLIDPRVHQGIDVLYSMIYPHE